MGCRQSKDSEETGAAGEGEGTAPKLVVVFGATGHQGGAVIAAMKEDNAFKLRAVTRNKDSDKAKALAESGVEVVQADMDDKESLKAALEGAHSVFLNTNYWEHFNSDTEIQQGKNVVDVAKESEVKHLVFSGSASIKEAIDKTADFCESKAAIEKYIAEQEVPFTVVRFALYYENILTTWIQPKNEDGDYPLGVPMGDSELEMICISDAGECVHQVFAQQEEYQGKTLYLASDSKKVEDMANHLTKLAEDRKFVPTTMSLEQLSKSEEIKRAADIAVLFEYLQSEKYQKADLDLTRKLNPNIRSFDTWADESKDAILAVFK